MRRTALATAAIALFIVATRPNAAGAQVVDEHNGSAPLVCSCTWGVYGVGFSYTATASFFLSTIETRFGGNGWPYGARNITAEIRTAPNGTVLGSTTFLSSPTADWIGGSFAPVLLTSGTTYFIDFLNVGLISSAGIGINAINTGSPSGPFTNFVVEDMPNGPWRNVNVYDPVVRLSGTEAVTATPEPGTITLMATGLLGVVGFSRRRRKKSLAA